MSAMCGCVFVYEGRTVRCLCIPVFVRGVWEGPKEAVMAFMVCDSVTDFFRSMFFSPVELMHCVLYYKKCATDGYDSFCYSIQLSLRKF